MGRVPLSCRHVSLFYVMEGRTTMIAAILNVRLFSTWRDTPAGRMKAASKRRAMERGDLDKYTSGIGSTDRPVTINSVGKLI